MFSDNKVAYFGLWAEESDGPRNRDVALRMLADMVAVCDEQDARTDECRAVIDWLQKTMTRPVLARRMWEAFAISDPGVRMAAAQRAYEALARNLKG